MVEEQFAESRREHERVLVDNMNFVVDQLVARIEELQKAQTVTEQGIERGVMRALAKAGLVSGDME